MIFMVFVVFLSKQKVCCFGVFLLMNLPSIHKKVILIHKNLLFKSLLFISNIVLTTTHIESNKENKFDYLTQFIQLFSLII